MFSIFCVLSTFKYNDAIFVSPIFNVSILIVWFLSSISLYVSTFVVGKPFVSSWILLPYITIFVPSGAICSTCRFVAGSVPTFSSVTSYFIISPVVTAIPVCSAWSFPSPTMSFPTVAFMFKFIFGPVPVLKFNVVPFTVFCALVAVFLYDTLYPSWAPTL